MADILDFDDSFHWSISKLAKCFGVHRQTMVRKLESSKIQPAGEFRGNAVYAVHDAARALFTASPGGPADLDQYPEARRAWYQSENERIKFETSTGQLIPQNVFVREISLLIKNLVNTLENLPDHLERDLELEPQTLVEIQNVIDAAREQMYLAAVQFDD